MKPLSLSAFRSNCESVFDLVYKTKRSIQIQKFGRVIAEICPPAVSKGDKSPLSVWNKARRVK